ncbi:MAG: NADH-quinone oxidoreductase subunit H, partial [Spirochaetes bacterium]|nr:NADH-quinone oxidoreductase subunit H [Spirochaetota bacterium]
INLLFLLFAPFLYLGLISKVKAFWASRKGPSLLQPVFDFIKLLKKDIIAGEATSYIFQISPVVGFSAVFFSGLLAPLSWHQSVINFEYNFIVFSYILGLGRFFSIIGAMDTGSSFEAMGASREVTFASLVEPGFFILLGTLSIYTGNNTFQDIFNIFNQHSGLNYLIISLSSIVLFILILVETSRMPVDDPNTHLELTMVHEVMVLDNSGPDLGFIIYGTGMKMVIFSSLIANIILPDNLNFMITFLFFAGIVAGLAVLIGCIESLMARLRMSHIPQFIFFMTAISLLIFFIIKIIPLGTK